MDYKADVEQPLPMIYQSGYLTDVYKRQISNGKNTQAEIETVLGNKSIGGYLKRLVERCV